MNKLLITGFLAVVLAACNTGATGDELPEIDLGVGSLNTLSTKIQTQLSAPWVGVADTRTANVDYQFEAGVTTTRVEIGGQVNITRYGDQGIKVLQADSDNSAKMLQTMAAPQGSTPLKRLTTEEFIKYATDNGLLVSSSGNETIASKHETANNQTTDTILHFNPSIGAVTKVESQGVMANALYRSTSKMKYAKLKGQPDMVVPTETNAKQWSAPNKKELETANPFEVKTSYLDYQANNVAASMFVPGGK